MTKENTINEAEARAFIHAKLTEDGVTITKTLLDKVLDTASDLSIAGLIAGQGIKIQGLGTIEVRKHQARTYSVPNKLVEDPDNPGQFLPRTFTTVDAPAGRHIVINTSPSLLEALNSTSGFEGL